MNKQNGKSEQFKINFLGMKFEFNNPGKTTIIILIILLIFFVAVVVLLKMYISGKTYMTVVFGNMILHTMLLTG